MGVRASLSALMVSSSLSGNARVSLSAAMIAQRLEGNLRVSAQYLMVAQSANSGFWLNPIESSSAIYGTSGFTVVLSAGPSPEANPYKPVVPDSIESALGADGYAYLEELQETIRQQHNLAQAGDTTFPYQLTITSSSIQHYRLGSVGRFYHEDYGVIQARYVQFSGMVAVDTPHSPVGLFKNASGLDWVVTNDYAKSHPDLVVGICAPWTLPADNDFGWVIVDGPNLQQVKNLSSTQSLGETLTWDSSGAVSNTAAGKVIARRVNKTDVTRLSAGAMWVRTESFSEAQINEIISEATQSLINSLNQLEVAIQALPSAAALRTLQSTVTSLRTTVSNEASARIASDLRLNERISNLDFITVTQLNAALSHASAVLESEITDINSTIAYVRDTVNASNARLDAIEGVEARIQDQITGILALLSNLNFRTRNKFPVVDGSVPPNLVYLPDGSLVWTEE